MSQLLDGEIDAKASKAKVRENFIKAIPVGTRVENPFIPPTELSHNFFAETAEGAIYDDPESDLVNVININGHKGLNGKWTASWVKKTD